MLMYVARRLLTAVFILFGASFLIYLLTAAAGDPLEELRTMQSANKEMLIAQRTEALNLDVPAPLRYFIWLSGVLGCFTGQCDFGQNLAGTPVTQLLSNAIYQTLVLVVASTILSILIGVSLGILSALRQYSGFDYTITFTSFLFFSLPSFWIAVLLKEFLAIGFNNFLRNPQVTIPTTLLISAIAGLFWFAASFGKTKTRILMGVFGFVLTAAIIVFVSMTEWMLYPFLGIPFLVILGLITAVVATLLISGLRNKRALTSGLFMVAVGLAIYFPVQQLLNQATFLMIVLITAALVLIGLAVGAGAGGYDRGQGMRVGAITGFVMALLIFTDRFMQSWNDYITNPRIKGRPIPTANASTPNLNGDFWITGLDTMTHILLPTIALTLISLASYSRYSRASMLEIMNQDYIRTARAKGVSERGVVMKHAFRNALIPLATIIAMDFGGIIGGAAVTERIFAFKGMGSLFLDSLAHTDPNPVMGVFLITGLMALVFNLVADLLYSVLDPRVRVKA
ncbi:MULTISPECIES: ABC transporter permease [unclassified Rothia (in: high G+C Gram-positive bacteria)]|uniref:ABC transporter permease n=1 Tax=unclassified Rothia (in: high G+C Gram-positive bacteria) TaxID=2689056 RepID=UPI00195DA585|nr:MULTISPECIES: ABC transporter permease [unclassified Rothia (in: high G+C Gram-positive bacteria)]MBM7052162.1 ABC transporter permease [Rothia sp. ZJ1223]QRZ61407.1 ABC transporter permease [Rothia sp. ZJ932]